MHRLKQPALPLLSLGWRLLLQEVRRSPGRILLLSAAVAIGSASIFLSLVFRQTIQRGLENSLNRLGADILILPKTVTHNLTAALLTGEPGSPALDPGIEDTLRNLPSIGTIAPQLSFTVESDEGHGETELVAFDPHHDITVLPWVREHLDRPFCTGDVIVGARRPEPVGSAISFRGHSLVVWGKLGLCGVGPMERSIFGSFDTFTRKMAGQSVLTGPARPSALLLRLRPGAEAGTVRFALASQPSIQVISGSGLGIQVRQAIRTILAGSLVATLTSLVMAGLLTLGVYAGVVLERKSELGLLLAMGLSRAGLSLWLAAEAALCALIGSLLGILIGAAGLAVFARSFGYLLISRGIDFTAPPISSLLFPAGISLFLCSVVAGLGALLPAWRLAGRELYQLIRDNRE